MIEQQVVQLIWIAFKSALSPSLFSPYLVFISSQCSRRILVVIGVINYPELDARSTSRLEQDMDYYSRFVLRVVLDHS
jgi:hypothetical protein